MGMSLAPWKVVIDPSQRQRVDAMADELRRLAAHLAAAEYRWLKLLAEFDAENGWTDSGAKTLAGWLSWACGLGQAAAREKVRVAKALPELPAVSEAFAAGRISYSKVRAITRVATPANEQLLVTYAECATAAQLETVLRGYRRVGRLEDARDAQIQHEQRYVRHWVDEDGCVRIEARLSPEDGALVVAELDRLAESGGEDHPAAPAETLRGVSAETAEASRGDLPVVASRWEASEPIEARRADALRMMAETAAAHGPTATVGGDTHLVIVNAQQEDLRSGEEAGLDCDAESAADPDVSVATEIAGVGRVSAETARRIACDSAVAVLIEDALGQPLGVGRQSRTVPRRLRRALMRRDRGRCRFPGCLATKFVDAHHIQHWADDGPTDLDNLVLLCRFHHRLVHEAGYDIDGTGNTSLRFLRPDGSVVPAHLPVLPGEAAAIEAANRQAGLDLTEHTIIPDWDGTPHDYSLAVGLLMDVSAETPAPAGSVA